MKRRDFIKFTGGLAVAASLPVSAFAHRKKHALAHINWNARTKNLEVIHDLFAHDAETALARLGRLDNPDLTPLRARANLALYCRDHFRLQTLGGKPLELTIVGAEVDTTYAHVYLEIPMRRRPKGLIVEDDILQDIFADHINQVIIDLGAAKKSLIFAAGDGPQKVLLSH